MIEDVKHPHLYTGAFCLCYGYDEETGQTLMLITERGARFAGISEGHGTLGGYLDLELKEQPIDGAAREGAEELPMPDGTPVLPGITADRLVLVASGIDYKTKILDSGLAGTVWHGHVCHLTNAEIKTLKAYTNKLKADPDFADAVRAASRQELKSAFLITPGEFLMKIQSGEIRFAYAHEQKVAAQTAETLQKNGPIIANILTL